MNNAAIGRRERQRTAVCLAAFLGIAYAYFYQGGGWNQNTRFALVRAIVEQGTLRIDDTVRFQGRLITGDLARYDGHIFSDKAPGLALAAVVPVAIARPLLIEPSSRAGIASLSYVATLAVAGLPTVLAALLVLWLCETCGATRGAPLFSALVFGLATPVWCYATLLYGHALASACVVAAFAAAVALRRAGSAPRDWLLAGAIGLAGGWATITEYPAVVPAAIIGLLALLNVWTAGTARRLRVIVGVSAGALACMVVLAAYNSAAFGSPWSLGYSNEAGDFHGMKQGFMGITYPKPAILWELTFGRFRGLFYFAPILALAPVGFALLLHGPAPRGTAVAAISIAVYYLLFNAAYFYWDGGWSYGPRHMAPALAFFSLALAPLWARGSPFVRIGLVALALYSAVGTLVAVSTTAQPPDDYKRPYSQLLWPNFASGHLSINQQAFVEDNLVRQRDPVAHAWNIGEKLGLTGHASLVPLFAIWAVLGFAWRRCNDSRVGPA